MGSAASALTAGQLTGSGLVDALSKLIAEAAAKYPATAPLSPEQGSEVAQSLRAVAEAVEKITKKAEPASPVPQGAATEVETLRAEIERLRAENEKLWGRLLCHEEMRACLGAAGFEEKR